MNTQIKNQVAFSLLGLTMLEDMSEIELRLTIFLFTYIFNSTSTSIYILKDEIITGKESYSQDGLKRYVSLGAGLHSKELQQAVHEVKERKLFKIWKIDKKTYKFKLNNKFINEETENFLSQWKNF